MEQPVLNSMRRAWHLEPSNWGRGNQTQQPYEASEISQPSRPLNTEPLPSPQRGPESQINWSADLQTTLGLGAPTEIQLLWSMVSQNAGLASSKAASIDTFSCSLGQSPPEVRWPALVAAERATYPWPCGGMAATSHHFSGRWAEN